MSGRRALWLAEKWNNISEFPQLLISNLMFISLKVGLLLGELLPELKIIIRRLIDIPRVPFPQPR